MEKQKMKISMRYARLMPNYQIRAGDVRHTHFYFTAYNFMKLFKVVDWEK